MVQEKFYEALNKNYSKSEFEKMKFRSKENNSIYRVSFKGDLTDLKESFEKYGCDLSIISPWNKEITDENVKKSLLSTIFHNGGKIGVKI